MPQSEIQNPRSEIVQRPLAMIAAASTNHVIGRDGDLPWHLPADLKFFKHTTSGHAIIMGRSTFETLLGPLPKRHNIILTRNRDYSTDHDVTVVHDLNAALAAAGEDPLPFICGGEQIYRLALPRATIIYLTRIHTVVEDGDAFFPTLDLSKWRLEAEADHPADGDQPGFTFQVWHREAS